MKCLCLVATCGAAACNGQPTTFPTAGVTVQAFPHVEVILPSDTPLPTDTALPIPTDTATLLPADTPPPTATETAIIRLILPTTVPAPVFTNTPRPPARTATPTSPPSAGPIAFRGVQLAAVARDPARPPDGSLVTLSVEFAGSRPPFSVKHDGQTMIVNANGDGKFENAGVNYTFIFFTIAKTCGGVITGTVSVTGGDGQTFTHDYYVPDAPCN
ncbi:MAG: hypothetical protein HYZ49_09200 [Chloroflexi bacterium]|nr:hypothetical protein [Chloroflexota bacterium]